MFHAWTRDVNQLKFICDSDPNCFGFNSNGYVKMSVSHQRASKGSTLYIKAENGS